MVYYKDMVVSGAAGFWSYSHADNERDGHGLLRLGKRIQDEYSLVTGEPLTLFVDRNDILWGDEWRRRIETALAETTFFIPVITPLYLKSHECRRELLSFVGQAQSLAAIELVLPILYVDVPGLTEDSTDEAVALVAKMQYADWRKLRLSPEDSAEYRKAVNALATRLADINSKYEQSSQQTIGANDAEEEEGILDLLEIVENKLPDWQKILDDGTTNVKQLDAIDESYTDRIKRVDVRGNTGPLLSVLRGYVKDTGPLMQRQVQYSKDFSAASIDLDPIILKVLRGLDNYPELSQHVFNALSPIEDAAEGIDRIYKENKRREKNNAIVQKYKGISKDIARHVRLWDLIHRYNNDANALVWNWHQEIQRYKT
jgi:hypothetical protein